MTKKKKGKARKFTPADERRVLAFYDKHGSGATLTKYQLSSGVLHRMKKSRPERALHDDRVTTRESFRPTQAHDVGDVVRVGKKDYVVTARGQGNGAAERAQALEALVLAREGVAAVEQEVRAGRKLEKSDGLLIVLRSELERRLQAL